MPASTSSASGPAWARVGRDGQPRSAFLGAGTPYPTPGISANPVPVGSVCAGSASRHEATRASAAPTVHANQPSRLTTRPVPSDTLVLEVTSPRSVRNSPKVTALSPSANSAPRRAVLGRETLSAISPALAAQAIT